MRYSVFIFSVVCAVLLFTLYAAADTVIWNTGRKPTECRIISENAQEIKIETYGGYLRNYPKKDVKEIIKGKTLWEIYGEKKRVISDTVVSHLSLAAWCHNNKLKNEAIEQWRRVIELARDNKEARQALGYINVGNEWRLEYEVMKENGFVIFEGAWVSKDKLPALMQKKGYAFVFRVTIVDDAISQDFEYISSAMKGASQFLWDATKGQFYITKVSISDKRGGGDIIIPKGKLHVSSLGGGDAATCGAGGIITLPGEANAVLICHEIGHSRMNLRDERDPNCESCLMSLRAGSIFCTKEEHGIGNSCWGTIMNRWPKLVGPENVNYEDTPPSTEIIIEDK